VTDESERVRRAIALLTQVRVELMCTEAYDFLDDSPDNASLVAAKAGSLRLELQLNLRKREYKERLEDESLEGIIKSREASNE